MGATTGTFSAVGAGTAKQVKPGEKLVYALSVGGGDDFIGTLLIQSSRDGGISWQTEHNILDALLSFTGTALATLTSTVGTGTCINGTQDNKMYRAYCLVYGETSDAAAYSIEVFPAAGGELASVDYAIGAEDTNVRAITIQLKDSQGFDLAHVQGVVMGVFADAGAAAFATGGSTGIAIGTDGALLAIVAKKLFMLTSESDGDIDLTWTDTGSEAVYLGILIPNGRFAMSAVIQNAA
jgi:hypothetical protein